MREITFFSYKGGVGRTLLLATLAKYLALCGKRVFVIDFDLEAPGLHYKLSLDKKLEDPKEGLLDYIAGFINSGKIPDDFQRRFVLEVPVESQTEEKGGGAIYFLPAGNPLSPYYWERLFRINWNDLFYEPRDVRGSDKPVSGGVALIDTLRRLIVDKFNPHYLLIDARTGITEMGGAAATLFGDVLIALTLVSSECLDGTRTMLWSFTRTRRLQGRDRLKIIPLVARVPEQSHAEEHNVLERVNEFLTAVPTAPEDHLNDLPEPMLLHSDRGIEIRERLLLHDPGDLAFSRLRIDCFRVMKQIIPEVEISSHLGVLANNFRARAWDYPEEAEKQIQDLVQTFPYPEPFKAQIQLLRLKKADSAQYLAAARRYWQLDRSHGSDSQVQDIVKAHFRPEDFLKQEEFPEHSPEVQLEFVSSVWKSTDPRNVEIGLAIAEVYKGRELPDEVRNTLSQMEAPTAYDEGIVVRWIRLLCYVQDFDGAFVVSDSYKVDLGMSDQGIRTVLALTVESGNGLRCRNLLESEFFQAHLDSLMKDLVENGEMLLGLHSGADALGRWREALEQKLRAAQDELDLYRLDGLFKASGLKEQFIQRLDDIRALASLRELQKR